VGSDVLKHGGRALLRRRGRGDKEDQGDKVRNDG
jgi:hypothetical protein